MKLSVSVIFLSWTAAFYGLLAVADPSPGILVRVSGKGLQYEAELALAWLDRRIDQGLRVPDKDGSFSPYLGSVDYFLTNIEVKKFSHDKPSVTVNPGTGVTASLGKVHASVEGKFSYKYTLMYIPTWNSGTFKLTISNLSLSIQATVGIGPDDHPTVDILSCSASVEDIDLTYQADNANWLLNLFSNTVKGKVKPTLMNGLCDAFKKGRDFIAKEVAKNIKPCINSMFTLCIDLRLVSSPVFGENFVETAHRGEIFGKNDTRLAPFEAPPFQVLPLSSKMVDLYVSAYVWNTLMYAMHQNQLLSFKLTKNDLHENHRKILDTSCESNGLCVGNILPKVFAPYPNASVELEFVSVNAPFLNISHSSFSVTFNVCAKLHVRKSNEFIQAVSALIIGGTAEGSVFTTEDGRIEFNVTDIMFRNASISDKEKETDLFKSKDLNVVGRLEMAAKEYLLPKINDFGQRSLSVTAVGEFHTVNRSINLVTNALVFTADVFYSKGKP